MASGKFSGEEHPRQHFNCCSGASVTMTRSTSEKDSSITEIQNTLNQVLHLLQNTALSSSTRECCCKGVTNLEEKLQDFMTGLKPLIVEEVKKVLAQFLGPNLHSLQHCVLPPNSSSLPNHDKSSTLGCYRLCFKGKLPNTMFTYNNIEEEGASLEVELLDEFGKRVEVGLDSGVKIKIDVLYGDFDAEDRNDWSEEDFKRAFVRPRDDKGPLLKGNNQFTLNGGVAGVFGFSITDNSKFTRSKRFKLGAEVIGRLPSGRVVRSAASKTAFQVNENRNINDQKHPTPSPEDDLWRLTNISRIGPVCGRALKHDIHTVKDFLRLYHTDEKKLKNILKLSKKRWAETVKNAKECKLSTEHYRYCDDASGNELTLDCAFHIKRVTFKGRTTQLYEHLDLTHKEKANKLRQSAYEKRNDLEIHDDSTNLVPTQGLVYPSSAPQQGQEEQEQQPAAALPPSKNPNVVSFSQNMIATTSGQIYAPVLYPSTTGLTGAYQGEILPVQAPYHGLDYTEYDSTLHPLNQGLPGDLWQNLEISPESPAGLMAWDSGDNNPSVAVNVPVQISDHRLDLSTSLPPERWPASYPCDNIPGMQQVDNCSSLCTNSSFTIEELLTEGFLESEAYVEDSQALSSTYEVRNETPSRLGVGWRRILVQFTFLVRLRRIDDYRPLKKQKT